MKVYLEFVQNCAVFQVLSSLRFFAKDIYDAKSAVDHLSGFNVGGRYLVVLYYQPEKLKKKAEADRKQKEIEELRNLIKTKKAQLETASE